MTIDEWVVDNIVAIFSFFFRKDCQCDYDFNGFKSCAYPCNCKNDQFDCGRTSDKCCSHVCLPISKKCDGRDDCGKESGNHGPTKLCSYEEKTLKSA